MLSAGFETTIPLIERLHTYALARTASGIGLPCNYLSKISPVGLLFNLPGRNYWQIRRLHTKIKLTAGRNDCFLTIKEASLVTVIMSGAATL